jgi:hypothetical protein
MGLSPEQTAELHDLLWSLRAGTASADELARLEQMVCDDPAARAFYVRYMHLCADLRWSLAAHSEQEQDGMKDADVGGESAVEGRTTDSTTVPPIILVDGNQSSPFGTSWLSSFPTFLFSYILAALLLGIGVLAGWMLKVSEHAISEQEIASGAGAPATVGPVENMQWVGRVSGLFDCRWVDPETEAFSGARVPLGRKYALASGLMEITYDTGAKVILEGPCTYQVERPSGGYLSLGKLAAQVEAKGGGGKAEGGGANQVLKSPNLQIPKSPNIDSPLFTVRTPTAVVTDLGTEFGVEYDRSGVTRSSVFRGSVTMQAVSEEGKTVGAPRILHENEMARVERSKIGQQRGGVLLEAAAKRPDFVRTMPKRTVRVFDLVDVVAGGNGFSHKRNGAVNPADGKILRDVAMPDYYRQHPDENVFTGDGRYHRVKGEPFIDGVFIPNGKQGPVQVDSAGHRFDGFPPTSNIGSGWIHGGGVIPCLADFTAEDTIPCVLGNIDYSSPKHGVLFIHSNKGITFDLDAIRAANSDHRIVAFRAVAGLSGEGQIADLWVLVDGKPRFVRRQVTGFSGAMHVSVPIRSSDRFLTLASTDGNMDIYKDTTMFGDPRLELISDDSGERRTKNTDAAR